MLANDIDVVAGKHNGTVAQFAGISAQAQMDLLYRMYEVTTPFEFTSWCDTLPRMETPFDVQSFVKYNIAFDRSLRFLGNAYTFASDRKRLSCYVDGLRPYSFRDHLKDLKPGRDIPTTRAAAAALLPQFAADALAASKAVSINRAMATINPRAAPATTPTSAAATRGATMHSSSITATSASTDKRANITCHKCGTKGHYANECGQTSQLATNRPSSGLPYPKKVGVHQIDVDADQPGGDLDGDGMSGDVDDDSPDSDVPPHEEH